MIFYLNVEEDALRDLKEELGIPASKPHCLSIELWRYSNARDSTLECKVSVFTSNNRCIQGRGGNFGDAIGEVRQALRPKSRDLGPQDEVKVQTED